MEHRKKGRKLGRTASHRKALLSNLAVSLIKSKRIKTTEAKAKELRTYIEPLISKAKRAYEIKSVSPEKDIHQRRVVRKYLKDETAVNMLFNEITELVKNRPGGYLRILKTGFRAGDSASEAIIEFVDFKVVKEQKSVKGKEEKPVEEKTDVKTEVKEAKKTTKKKETVKKPKSEKSTVTKKTTVKKIEKADTKTTKRSKSAKTS